MKYTQTITKTFEIEMTGNWNKDVQSVISMALHMFDNNTSKATSWINNLDVTGNYEFAVQKEALAQLTRKTLDSTYSEELGQIFVDIFANVFGNRSKH